MSKDVPNVAARVMNRSLARYVIALIQPPYRHDSDIAYGGESDKDPA